MRTTLTLDDDLMARLRDLARRRGTSLREVVNDLLRRGINTPAGQPHRKRAPLIKTFRSGFRPGVDPERLNQLSDDLETRRVTDRK